MLFPPMLTYFFGDGHAAASVLQNSDCQQDQDNGDVTKRMDRITHQENTNYERHDRRDVGNTTGVCG